MIKYLKVILLLTDKGLISKWVVKTFISIHSEERWGSKEDKYKYYYGQMSHKYYTHAVLASLLSKNVNSKWHDSQLQFYFQHKVTRAKLMVSKLWITKELLWRHEWLICSVAGETVSWVPETFHVQFLVSVMQVYSGLAKSFSTWPSASTPRHQCICQHVRKNLLVSRIENLR